MLSALQLSALHLPLVNLKICLHYVSKLVIANFLLASVILSHDFFFQWEEAGSVIILLYPGFLRLNGH